MLNVYVYVYVYEKEGEGEKRDERKKEEKRKKSEIILCFIPFHFISFLRFNYTFIYTIDNVHYNMYKNVYNITAAITIIEYTVSDTYQLQQ